MFCTGLNSKCGHIATKVGKTFQWDNTSLKVSVKSIRSLKISCMVIGNINVLSELKGKHPASTLELPSFMSLRTSLHNYGYHFLIVKWGEWRRCLISLPALSLNEDKNEFFIF